MKHLLLLITLLLLPKILFAGSDLSHFQNRFEIKTNAQGNKVIVDNSLLENIDIEIYLKNFSSYLSVSDTDINDEVFSCKGFDYEKPDLELSKSFGKALDWLKNTDISKLLNDPKFIKFIKEIETVTAEYTKDPDFSTVANLDNPSFFFDKAFIKFLQKKIVGLATSYFGATAYLKIVNYIGEDYSNFIVNKKLYHQNILAYYLEHFRADQLGLTESEKRKAFSSLIDAKLSFGFGGIFESRKIKKNFDEYGYKKLQEADKNGEQRWEKNSKLFDDRLYKINSSFSEALYAQSPLTVNVGVKKDKSDGKPSLVIDSDCPEFIYKNRRTYEQARLALGMSPIPYTGKLFTLIKSKYQPQALIEGMYVGHLEATGQLDKKEIVLKQSMNPLLK